MISAEDYMERMKNCANWNSTVSTDRRRSRTAVYDSQTGVVQRPSKYLYKHYTDRETPPPDSEKFIVYAAPPWTKSKTVSYEAMEMKFFQNSNPALNEALSSILNVNLYNQTDNSIDGSFSRASYSNKYESNDIDMSEYDMDEPDNDPSDEDDWSSTKKKRKRGNQNNSNISKGRRGIGVANSANSSMYYNMPGNNSNIMGISANNGGMGLSTPAPSPIHPYICQICGAKYKSRPGLTYHRSHVHPETLATPQQVPPPQPQQHMDISHSSTPLGFQ